MTVGVKKILYGIVKCGIPFIKYNYFATGIMRRKGCYLYPFRGSIVRIASGARLILNGDLKFNAGKYRGSKAESYLIIDERATLSVEGATRINYGSTVHICKNATVHIGSMTTNVGLNIQCRKSISIGDDCMFGRNATIFDSSFHPTGITEESMSINSEAVNIGNHVWTGAHAFIMLGTEIGNGSIIGSGAYVRGKFGPAVTILAKNDVPSLTDTMWARSTSPKEIAQAVGFYANHQEETFDEGAVRENYDRVYKLLTKVFPDIDLKKEKNLVKNHVLDSLSIMTVISVLSEEYGSEIPYNEISARNFDSIEAMAALVGRLRPVVSAENTGKKAKETHDYHPDHKDTLIEYVKEYAEHIPQKTAVISDGKAYSYEELYSYVRKYSAFLQENGLHEGDMVVVKASQSISYIIIYLAVHYSRGVIITVEKTATNEKILETAGQVAAKMVICDDESGIASRYIFVDSTKVFEHLTQMDPAPESFPSGRDSADILFTTGTTGKSKGVELSHAAIIAGAENIAFGCQMKQNTVLVVPNPLSHSNAIKNMAACFVSGCTFYVLDGIADLSAYFHALDYPEGKVATVLPPAAIRTIFLLAKKKLAEYVDRLDYLMTATAPLPEPDRETLRQLLPKTRLYNHYGCSESSSICIYDFNEYAELKNCAGKAMPHSQVFFVDDERHEIKSSPDNIGLLAVRGDTTMKGYFNAPELTNEILVGNAIYTRDMGYTDENGFVFILGRNDDVINVGGLKVSPLEVEEVALSYDGVKDCICVAVDDKITGEALKLLVVADARFEMPALKVFLASKLEPYKVPRQYEIVSRIERTSNGKLNRKYYR